VVKREKTGAARKKRTARREGGWKKLWGGLRPGRTIAIGRLLQISRGEGKIGWGG